MANPIGAGEVTLRAVMELEQKVCDRARLARDPRFDGQFFIAVVSTGVYCRPICPSPHARSENVVYYRTGGEAAAAGFRACLRCRPEAAPGTPAWKGTSATVSRALRLIVQGGLQQESLASLSRRLGVSARHLDRLFLLHLGTSPTAVARTCRLNFAKQLLRDTDLPMSEVALAAGFRTVRRFNDSMRSLCGRTPSELRRLRSSAPHARQDEYVFRLPYRPPFDWESLLEFFAARAAPGVEEVVSGAYRRTFAQEGRHGIVEVRHAERGPALELRVRFSEALSLLPIVTRVRGMFDVASDVSAIARDLSSEPLLRPLIRMFPGLRLPGAWDPFELSVRAVLGQGLTAKEEALGAGRLAQGWGERLSFADDGGLTDVFPGPETLARARLEGLPEGRAEAIRFLARAALDGFFERAESDESSLASLARVGGIGEGTAQYVAMRGYHRPDAFPSQDPILRRAVGGEFPCAAAALAALAQRWRPWRAYAAVYLWSAADAASLGLSPDLLASVAEGV
jgi:AraC family transcriptional regulator of adaptative response / DNA-3-methyladenine glycosylase II